MKCIVVGANGFIGKHIHNELTLQGHISYPLSRQNYDLVTCKLDKFRKDIEEVHPDYIYHYAGNPLVKESSHKSTLDNVVATHRLLDACPENIHFVFASSATVYGPHTTERNVVSPLNPSSVYALNKLHCEKLIQQYYLEGKIKDYTIIRYVAHVGGTHGLIHDIINKLKSDSKVLSLLNNSKKPYLDVQESVKATIELVEKGYSIANIAPSNNISVLSVAEIIMEQLNIFKPIEFAGTSWNGDDDYVKVKSDAEIMSSEEAIRNYVKTISNR